MSDKKIPEELKKLDLTTTTVDDFMYILVDHIASKQLESIVEGKLADRLQQMKEAIDVVATEPKDFSTSIGRDFSDLEYTTEELESRLDELEYDERKDLESKFDDLESDVAESGERFSGMIDGLNERMDEVIAAMKKETCLETLRKEWNNIGFFARLKMLFGKCDA